MIFFGSLDTIWTSRIWRECFDVMTISSRGNAVNFAPEKVDGLITIETCIENDIDINIHIQNKTYLAYITWYITYNRTTQWKIKSYLAYNLTCYKPQTPETVALSNFNWSLVALQENKKQVFNLKIEIQTCLIWIFLN